MTRTGVVAFAPGSIGNVGPGLDVLGLAVAGAGDAVHADFRSGPDIVVLDAGHPDLPTDPASNTAAIAAAAVRRQLDDQRGLALSVTKGLPLSGGQGGSAASAIAGAVATDALLGGGLSTEQLLACALEAEATVAGRHLDNLAPSLLGGLILIRAIDPIDVVRLTLPPELQVVLVHPAQRMRTRDARAVLPASVPRGVALQQAANIAAMVAGACLGDLALFGRAIDDQIAEPARAPLLPGFLAARDAALGAGALGCSISGAGPTAFALAADPGTAAAVARAMTAAYRSAGLEATATITQVDYEGARLS
ncbi:MAG: homoserine kinase [Gemmatimonadota bacterium]